MTDVAVGPGTRTVLSVEGVTKTFPGMRALDDVSFDVAQGSFHALVGGNGSGKSTLIKVLAGVYQGDPGGRLVVGHAATSADEVSPSWSAEAGVRFVHQDLGLFGPMTVTENLFVGRTYPRVWGRVDWSAMHREAQQHLDRLSVAVDVRRTMDGLRPAEQTLVAIARCLMDGSGQAELLVLDEPTARLPQAEVDELLDRLGGYVRDGQSILYVSHRLEEILERADTVTVLRDGRHIATRGVAGLDRAALTSLIVGDEREISTERSARAVDKQVVLRAQGLSGGPLRSVDLQVHRGEIVALAGLVGSGRTSLLESIFGVHRSHGGRVEINGRVLRPGSIADAIAAGLAYVPEDRARDSAFRELGVEMNLSAANVRSYRRGGWFRRADELRDANADIERLSIKTPGARAPLAQLSGGNQQKAVVARWLRLSPSVLLLDEPTQGVDVGARAEIYAQIEHAVDQGASVLLVTSDMDELLHLADRVLVLTGGRVADSATQDALTREWVATRMFDAHQEMP